MLYNILYLLFNKEPPYTELVNEFLFTLYTLLTLTVGSLTTAMNTFLQLQASR
jgi:hypothetical protein